MNFTISKELQNFITDTGFSLEELFARSGIPNMMWKEELVLSPENYYKFLSGVNEIITDDQLLAFSDIKNYTSFIPPLFVALCAKNALEGYERFSKFKRLVCPLLIQMKKTDNYLSITLDLDIAGISLPKFSLINEQLIIIDIIRTGTGRNINPVSVKGPFTYSEKIKSHIGITPEMADYNEILFDIKDVQLPFITQNNVMWTYLEPELQRRLDELSEENSFINILEKKLFSAIPSGHFSRNEIAAELDISVRSMQRKLSEIHTTFAKQVQKVQKLISMNYVTKNDLSLNEIACIVGYSDQVAFSRAFKNWTGMTVTQYRQQNQSSNPPPPYPLK